MRPIVTRVSPAGTFSIRENKKGLQMRFLLSLAKKGKKELRKRAAPALPKFERILSSWFFFSPPRKKKNISSRD